jgi:inhibitor of KinA sporulation pathway (predicted exonuclease)
MDQNSVNTSPNVAEVTKNNMDMRAYESKWISHLSTPQQLIAEEVDVAVTW